MQEKTWLQSYFSLKASVLNKIDTRYLNQSEETVIRKSGYACLQRTCPRPFANVRAEPGWKGYCLYITINVVKLIIKIRVDIFWQEYFTELLIYATHYITSINSFNPYNHYCPFLQDKNWGLGTFICTESYRVYVTRQDCNTDLPVSWPQLHAIFFTTHPDHRIFPWHLNFLI